MLSLEKTKLKKALIKKGMHNNKLDWSHSIAFSTKSHTNLEWFISETKKITLLIN